MRNVESVRVDWRLCLLSSLEDAVDALNVMVAAWDEVKDEAIIRLSDDAWDALDIATVIV